MAWGASEHTYSSRSAEMPKHMRSPGTGPGGDEAIAVLRCGSFQTFNPPARGRAGSQCRFAGPVPNDAKLERNRMSPADARTKCPGLPGGAYVRCYIWRPSDFFLARFPAAAPPPPGNAARKK